MSQQTGADSPAVDRFEQRVVWRVSRGLYLVVAGLASLVLVGGAGLLVWGMSPTFRGSDPAEPPAPTPPTVTLEEVLATLDGPQPEGIAPEGADAPSFEPAALAAEEDGDAAYNRRFQELATKLKMMFDETRHPWLSEQSVVCTSQGYYGCYNYERRTTRVGVVEMVNGRLKRMASASPEQRLALLQALVDVTGAVSRTEPPEPRDDLRFVAVGAVLDMAYRCALRRSSGLVQRDPRRKEVRRGPGPLPRVALLRARFPTALHRRC